VVIVGTRGIGAALAINGVAVAVMGGGQEAGAGHRPREAQGMSAAPIERQTAAARMMGLRANSFAAIVILLIEYGLGVWVNLYGHLPVSDHGANIATGFAQAVSKGPAGVSIHAVLGAILVISAVTAIVRAALVRRLVMVGAAAVGLVAIVVAAFSGASFVGDGSNGASLSMAVAAGVAIGSYALVLLLSAGAAESAPADDAPQPDGNHVPPST
jgi:hypothetical protein